MKKIIPFKKEIEFKNPIYEVTSISLEHTLHVENEQLINGEFIVTGDYRITESSTNTEDFNFNLPIDIDIDEHYIIDNAEIDIEDFYYEIINNDRIAISIDVKIDHLIEKPLIEKEELLADVPRKEDEYMLEQIEENENTTEHTPEIEEREEITEAFDTKEEVKSLFSNMDLAGETYTTYKVCIIREGENLESIMNKYGITRELLELYNDLKDIKIGDKIIIPNAKN